jgi:hypothetical protein
MAGLHDRRQSLSLILAPGIVVLAAIAAAAAPVFLLGW